MEHEKQSGSSHTEQRTPGAPAAPPLSGHTGQPLLGTALPAGHLSGSGRGHRILTGSAPPQRHPTERSAPAGCSPPRTLNGADRLRSRPSAGRLWSYLSQSQFVGEPHEELSNPPEFLLLAETLRKTECSQGPREKSNFSTWLLRSTVRREIQFRAVLQRIFRKTRFQTDRNSQQNEETPMEPTAACSELTPAGRTAQPASLPAPRIPTGSPHPRPSRCSPSPAPLFGNETRLRRTAFFLPFLRRESLPSSQDQGRLAAPSR
ncbi:uncharacterized protein LOC125699932 [Lagopus muta]|uniref:uncharacterized protein LOC125699932 n=1 Tax=Lagopus muta TaxID=64668 RepID=UPI00209D3FDC|nr:uncharacterized protein LOC125699932 [Lagopus muta]